RQLFLAVTPHCEELTSPATALLGGPPSRRGADLTGDSPPWRPPLTARRRPHRRDPVIRAPLRPSPGRRPRHLPAAGPAPRGAATRTRQRTDRGRDQVNEEKPRSPTSSAASRSASAPAWSPARWRA